MELRHHRRPVCPVCRACRPAGFQSARLHREQERLAVANDTIEFARSEFSNADDEVARYRSAALGYYAEHGGTYIMPYDYSAGFEGYCKRHPIPAPLLDLGS